jgi:hypothetical protein
VQKYGWRLKLYDASPLLVLAILLLASSVTSVLHATETYIVPLCTRYGKYSSKKRVEDLIKDRNKKYCKKDLHDLNRSQHY